MEEVDLCRPTEEIGNGNTDAKGTDNALNHNENRFPAAVEITAEAEQEGG